MVTKATKAPAKKAAATKAPAKAAAPKAEGPKAPKLVDGKLDMSSAPLADAEEPIEADLDEWRKPQRPTPAAVKALPHALIMLAWDTNISTDFGSPGDRDFQGFDELDALDVYIDIQKEFSVNDVKNFGDFNHVLVVMKDTESASVDQVLAYAKDAKWKKEVVQYIKDNPDVLYSVRRKRSTEDEAPAPSAKKPAKKAANAPTKKPTSSAGKVRSKATDAPNDGVPQAKKDKVEALNEKLAASKARRAALAEKRDQAAAAPAPATKKPVKRSAA